jgi:molecular chaperone GrpE (heat shock protein)
MSAVDVRTDPDVPPGTVLVVQRSGYAVNGVVKAIAQVTVSKR